MSGVAESKITVARNATNSLPLVAATLRECSRIRVQHDTLLVPDWVVYNDQLLAGLCFLFLFLF